MAKKILIIDDEKDMRTYLGTLFRKADYQVQTADNGSAGLDAARNFRPDVITLDILMPRQSGLRTYRELRSSAETRGIPVIILTGLAQQEDFFAELGSLPRPEAIFEKPIDRDEFLKRVAEVVGD